MVTADKLKKNTPIHDTLTGYDFKIDEPLRPLAAMRKKCLECASTSDGVKACVLSDCTLWPYRSGRRPGGQRGSNGRKLSPEHLAKMQAARKAR